MERSTVRFGRERDFDVTALSTINLLVALGLVCGGLWSLVLSVMLI